MKTKLDERLDVMERRLRNPEPILRRVAEEVVLPAFERNYNFSGIKQGGRRTGMAKQAVTKPGAKGNVLRINGNTLTAGVDYDQVKHLRWLFEGRGPVRPRRANVLRWVDPDTGKTIFSKFSGPSRPHPVIYLTGADIKKAEKVAGTAVLVE